MPQSDYDYDGGEEYRTWYEANAHDPDRDFVRVFTKSYVVEVNVCERSWLSMQPKRRKTDEEIALEVRQAGEGLLQREAARLATIEAIALPTGEDAE